MRTVNETKMEILAALEHGPLNHFTIAEQIDQAPFHIRGWLRHLKRERLVRELLDGNGHRWEITDRGRELVAGDRQIRWEVGS